MFKISEKMLLWEMACGENEIWSQESLFCNKLRKVIHLPLVSEIQNFLLNRQDCRRFTRILDGFTQIENNVGNFFSIIRAQEKLKT